MSGEAGAPRVLAVNPGATSTKVGLYEGAAERHLATLRHDDDVLGAFAGRPVLEQLDMRAAAIAAELARHALAGPLAAVAGRGGLLAPLASGTYLVDDAMLEDLRAARRGEHASNLGAFLARRLAEPHGCPAFIVDPVSVDEWEPVARYSGLAGLERECLSHALNTKAVAKRFAAETGRPYAALRLVVAHLGSGVSVSAHRDGRMVDVCNPREEGPFSADRAGGLPVMKLLALAAAEPDRAALERRLFGEGGLYSYLGTRDLEEVERRIDAGDSEAAAVFEAMAYQIGKEIGAMAMVLEGDVDAVLLTGGMARSRRLMARLERSVAWVAAVRIYPGEDELRALAEGALRVLSGQERARRYAARDA